MRPGRALAALAALASCRAGAADPAWSGPVPLGPGVGGGAVTLAWLVHGGSVSLSVTAKPSPNAAGSFAALSLALGTQMAPSTAFVGWPGGVAGYAVSATSASGVVPTGAPLPGASFAQQGGVLQLNVTLPAASLAPLGALPLVWALFPSWASPPADTDEHTDRSEGHVLLNLTAAGGSPVYVGSGGLPTAYTAHGVLMGLAWGVIFPGGALAARHLKAVVPGPQFFKAHMACNAAGTLFVVVAFALVYWWIGPVEGHKHFNGPHSASRGVCGERGRAIDTARRHPVLTTAHLCPLHPFFTVKFGLFTFVLFWLQPLNGFLRPPKAAPGGAGAAAAPPSRALWELCHASFGRILLGLALLTCLSGIAKAGEAGGRPASVKAGLVLW